MAEDDAVGRVLVVGSINEDVVLRVPRAPRPGETLAADGRSLLPGGKGANQAVAAARAGAPTALLARTGTDDAGGRMRDDLRAAGVDTDLVLPTPDTDTGAAYITVTPDGENTIVLDPAANAELSEGDVAAHADAIRSAAVLVAQLEVPVATVAAAVSLAVQAGVRPVVTLAPAQDVPPELLAGLDPLLVNATEAGFLLDCGEVAGEDAEDAAGRLLALGPVSVVLTLGAAGAVLATPEGVERLPAEKVEVVDSTGAGDALAGALAAALARKGTRLRDAVLAGMAAAADAVTRPGAR